MNPRAWYRIQNAGDDPTVAEILIFDSIGQSWWSDDTVTAKKFAEDLKALSADVTKIVVRINSLGGDVYDAVTIANLLRDQAQTKGRTVETVIDGIAASAASIVAMAGSVVKIADTGILMIHDPWTIGIGNSRDFQKLAEDLEKIRDASIVPAYQWHTELAVDEILALMAAETYMSADEAVEKGFATEKVEGLKASASITPLAAAAMKVPAQFRDQVAACVKAVDKPVAAAATDVLRICREAGCLDLAEGFIQAGAPIDRVTADVTTAKATRKAAADREKEIRATCNAAGHPDLADGYVRGQMSPADVRQHLSTITAKLDHVEIDGSLLPDAGQQAANAAGWKKAFARSKGRAVAH